MLLKDKTVAVGITGGIAVYKICDVVSKLVKLGADVRVVMTKNATEFVSALTFETLTKNKVITKMFNPQREWEVEHISLAKKADLFLIAPCTANMVGKIAGGIADDFLSTTIMAASCPVLIAPAMNTNMLNSPAYRQNETVLKNRGFLFIEPDDGLLACGDSGKGRLASVDSIVNAVANVLKPKQDYAGKRVLITLGSTREYLDPVRYITNKSSGKMGAELARAAYKRGAEVTAVCGFVSVELPAEIKVIKVETAQEMHAAVMQENNYDYYIMTAAVADFKPLSQAENKIKDSEINLTLTKNPDIAASVGAKKGNARLIIFSAETQNLVKNAQAKLIKKNADMVIANDVTQKGAGFDVDTNIATIITQKSKEPLALMQKSSLANIILDKAINL